MRNSVHVEVALLELMATNPPEVLPPSLLIVAVQMRRRGLATTDAERWYPTALGLKRTGRTLH